MIGMPGLRIDPLLLWAAREVFRYPTELQMLQGKEELFSLIDWAEKTGVQGAGALKANVENEAFDIEELEVDFTSLFVNGFPRTKAHPFAGWHLGEEITFGPSAQKMKQFYKRYGIELDPEHTLPADHIMVELEFLAVMIEEYAKTNETVFYFAVEEMLTGHMEKWIYKFLQDMETGANSSYYKNLANVISSLFKELTEELKEVA